MALKTAAENVETRRPGPRCGFGHILSALEDTDYAYYEQMCSEGRTSSYIGEVFRSDGHDVSGGTIARHRRGDCTCR